MDGWMDGMGGSVTSQPDQIRSDFHRSRDSVTASERACGWLNDGTELPFEEGGIRHSRCSVFCAPSTDYPPFFFLEKGGGQRTEGVSSSRPAATIVVVAACGVLLQYVCVRHASCMIGF